MVRLLDPRSTALVFASGKLVRLRYGMPCLHSTVCAHLPLPPQVVTGAASEALALLAARRHARAIQRFGYPVTFKARPK